MDGSPLSLAIFAVAVVVGGLIFLGLSLERKRTRALAAIADRLGLSFDPARDRALARTHENLRGLHEGSNRHASKVFRGDYRGHQVTAFDFRFETTSRDAEGRTTTETHDRHVVLLALGRTFPGILITPEGLFSKIAQAFGYDDIDFESHEFSRRYCVRSPDKRFAYDFCHARMIERLLGHPVPSLQAAGDILAIVHRGAAAPSEIEPRLDQIVAIRELLPGYLFTA